MRIPSVITSGELLARIRYHWDELIAYLRATRLVAGNGISISEHPTGTIISVNPQPVGGAGSAGGSVELRVITTAPSYGSGPAQYKKVVSIDAQGVVTLEGGTAHSTIVPRLP